MSRHNDHQTSVFEAYPKCISDIVTENEKYNFQ